MDIKKLSDVILSFAVTHEPPKNRITNRYVSLDFARGIAIVLMIVLHTISRVLDKSLLDEGTFETLKSLNLILLLIIPFLGGLAGFFLLISAAGNMISFYRDLERGKPLKSLVFKQIMSGILLLIFAMLCEGLIGYNGALGSVFTHLNNPAGIKWQILLYRWNHFETIHTIAWCIIINGCVQGLLSLKGNWKNTRKVIITYAILAFAVVGLTQLVWYLCGLIPGYPFGTFSSGHEITEPWIGTETFWEILRTPFLNMLAGPMEPIFPYLAVSFIGSIIGIVLSKPREEINKEFPRNMFLFGLIMFIVGLIGVIVTLIVVMDNAGMSAFLDLYQLLPYHRHWSPDYEAYIPLFSWLWQFLCLNGFSIMLLMLLFRLVEFRGKSNEFAKRTKFVRRFGMIPFTNYNNQFIVFFTFFLVTSIYPTTPYQKLFWPGVVMVTVLSLLLYHGIMLLWEKIKYFGSLEWIIKTIANNAIPARRESFDSAVKWWQKGLVEVDDVFYNANWINLGESEKEMVLSDDSTKKVNVSTEESKLAFIFSLVGLCSILFMIVSIFALFLSLNARKVEGKNVKNRNALIISIAGIILFAVYILVLLIIPIDALGLF